MRRASNSIGCSGSWHASRAFYTRDPDGVTVEILQRP